MELEQKDIKKIQEYFPHINDKNMKVYQEGAVIMKNGIEKGREQIKKMKNEQSQQIEIAQQTK